MMRWQTIVKIMAMGETNWDDEEDRIDYGMYLASVDGRAETGTVYNHQIPNIKDMTIHAAILIDGVFSSFSYPMNTLHYMHMHACACGTIKCIPAKATRLRVVHVMPLHSVRCSQLTLAAYTAHHHSLSVASNAM
jgi:hypothetical protein